MSSKHMVRLTHEVGKTFGESHESTFGNALRT